MVASDDGQWCGCDGGSFELNLLSEPNHRKRPHPGSMSRYDQAVMVTMSGLNGCCHAYERITRQFGTS